MNCKTWCARDCHQKCRFHRSCLMGSYPRREWYHDCPHWKCQSRHCLPIHQTFLSVTVLPLKRGGKRKKKTTTNPPRMCYPSEWSRWCQIQICVQVSGSPWFREGFSKTHACLLFLHQGCLHQLLWHLFRQSLEKCAAYLLITTIIFMIGFILWGLKELHANLNHSNRK